MKTYKILVIGPFNAGKTTLIRTLCKEYLNTDKKLFIQNPIKQVTTVALDFGVFEISEKTIRLYGTPGQERFSFMWNVLSKGMNGYILMIDSGDIESLEKAGRIYDFLRKAFPKTPHIVAVNKYDKPGFKMSCEDVRSALSVPSEIPVRPSIAINRKSAVNLIKSLITLIEEKENLMVVE